MVVACVLLSGCYRQRSLHAVFPKGRPTPDVVLEVWLTKSCSVGELAELEREMRRLGDQLTPKLIAAFEELPPKEKQELVAKHERESLVRMKKAVERSGLGLDQRWLVLDRTEECHVNSAVERYIRNRRSAALAGLGEVETRRARAYLEKESTDDKSSFQPSAQQILRTRRRR